MAATVEGTFRLRDNATRTLEKIRDKALQADAAVAKLGRSLDMVGAKKQLAQLSATEKAMGKLDAASKSTTREVDKQTNVLGRHERQMKRSESVLERFGRKMILVFGGLSRAFMLLKIPAMITGITALVPIVAALGAGLVSLVPKLLDAGGALAALGPAIVGMGLAMGTVKLAFGGLKEAMGGNAEALAKLTPQARRFTETLKSWKPLVEEFRKSAQKGLFGGLDASLNRLKVAAPTVNRLLSMMGERLGKLAELATARFTTRGFLKDFEALGRTGGILVTRMGRAMIFLIDAMRHISIAAQPLTLWLSRVVLGWAKVADESARAGRTSGRLTAYFERTRASLTTLGHILRDVWSMLRSIGQAARPLGDDLYGSIEKATHGWAVFLRGAGGQMGMRRFFESTRDTIHEVFGLVGDLSKALGRLSGQQGTAAGMVGGLRAIVPPLEKILTAMLRAFGPAMIDALVTLARTIELLGQNGVGPFTLMLNTLSLILKIVNGLISRIPQLGTLIVSAFAVGAMMRASRAIMGIAESWGLVTASATRAAAAQAAASGVPMVGGGRRGGWGGVGRLFGRGRAATTVAEEAATVARGVPLSAAAAGRMGTVAAGAGKAAGLAKYAGWGAKALPAVGKVALPLMAVSALMSGLTARRTGSVGNQIAQTGSKILSDQTFGLLPQYEGLSARDRAAGTRDAYFGTGDTYSTGRRAAGVAPSHTVRGRGGVARVAGGRSLSVDTQGMTYGAQFQNLTSINATTGKEQATVLSRLGDLQAQAQGQVNKAGSSPEAAAALAMLQQEIAGRRELLALTRHQERAVKNEKARGAAGSLLAGFDHLAGRVDPRTGKLDPKQAKRALAALRKQTAAQLEGATPGEAAAIGRPILKAMEKLGKDNPELKKAIDPLKTSVYDKFKDLHVSIKQVNGKIADGTARTWESIRKKMTDPAQLMEQDVTKAFTNVQEQALGALRAMGYTAAEAKKFITDAESKGTPLPSGGPGTATGSGATSSQSRARGGRISGSGLRDTVPIGGAMAAPGELVVNRHTERRADSRLGGSGALAAMVGAESVPHHAQNGIEPGLAQGGRVPGRARNPALDLGGLEGSPLMKAIAAAQRIDAMHYPYAWGGGHGRIGVPGAGTRHSNGGSIGTGFDCSGATSAVLGAAGLLGSPMVASSFMHWGVPGYDPHGINVVASPSHVYMMLNGRAFGTSSANPNGGAGFFGGGIRSGFTVNHVKNPGAAFAKMKALAPPGSGLGGMPGVLDAAAGAAYAGGMTGGINRAIKAQNGIEPGLAMGGRVPGFGGWFGRGGTATFDRPTLIGVGDGGTETVSVSRGSTGGGHSFVVKIGSIVNHGGDVQREIEAALESFARKVGSMGVVGDEDVIS